MSIYLTCPCVSTHGKSMIQIWSILLICLRSITFMFITLGFELGKWSGPMCSTRRIYEDPRVKAIPHVDTDSITLLDISPCTLWINMLSIKRKPYFKKIIQDTYLSYSCLRLSVNERGCTN